jgi:hypothetical protein
MAVLTLVVGSVSFFVAAFAAWYTLWHRRVESCFERVPVGAGRAVHVLRKGVLLEGDGR